MGDLVVAEQKLDNRLGILTVTVHSNCQRLETSQGEVVVERAANRTDRVLQIGQPISEFGVVGGEETTDDLGVAAAVFGGRVHDDVGAVAQRLLEIRGGKRVVDDETGVAFVHDLGDRRDVDDGQQWVGRRLGPHDLGPAAWRPAEHRGR